MERRADTVRILGDDLGLPQSTIYRVLGDILKTGFIVKVARLRTGRRRAAVYAVWDYTESDVADAVQRDRLSRTPGYAEVQRITQLILDDYYPLLRVRSYENIHSAEVMAVVKRAQRGFRSLDLFKPVMERLREQNILVVKSSIIRVPVPEV